MELKKYFSQYKAMNTEQGMSENPENLKVSEEKEQPLDVAGQIDKVRTQALRPLEAVLKNSDPNERKEVMDRIDKRVQERLGGNPLDKKFIDAKVAASPEIQKILSQFSSLIS